MPTPPPSHTLELLPDPVLPACALALLSRLVTGYNRAIAAGRHMGATSNDTNDSNNDGNNQEIGQNDSNDSNDSRIDLVEVDDLCVSSTRNRHTLPARQRQLPVPRRHLAKLRFP